MPVKCGHHKQLVTLPKLKKYSDGQQNLSFLSLTRLIFLQEKAKIYSYSPVLLLERIFGHGIYLQMLSI